MKQAVCDFCGRVVSAKERKQVMQAVSDINAMSFFDTPTNRVHIGIHAGIYGVLMHGGEADTDCCMRCYLKRLHELVTKFAQETHKIFIHYDEKTEDKRKWSLALYSTPDIETLQVAEREAIANEEENHG